MQGGLGGRVAEVCAKHCPTYVQAHGVPMSYATSGSYQELLEYYQLDTKGIIRVAMGFFQKVIRDKLIDTYSLLQ